METLVKNTPLIINPVNYEMLMNAPKPEQTRSYFPISHKELVEYVHERLDKANIKVVNETYNSNGGSSQMFASMGLMDGDTEMRYALGFRNSTDKSLPVGFVAGTQVIVCSNLMLSGDVKQVRRHTTNISKDLDEKFDLILGNIEGVFGQIRNDADQMKETELSRDRAAKMFGELLLRNERNLAPVQTINRAVELFKEPIHNFGNETVWGFYNAFTEAFKESLPKRAANQHLNFHNFVKEEFHLN